MNKRQEQKELRRIQILEASLDLFIRNGYHGTTTKEIAESFGISQGLMFHYFESKEALYLELLRRAKTGTETVYDASMVKEYPLEILQKLLELILESFTTVPMATKLFMLVAQAQIGTNLPDKIKETANELASSEMFEIIIKAGQDKGVIRKGNPKALAGCLFSSIQGIAQTYICYPNVPLPESLWLLDIVKM